MVHFWYCIIVDAVVGGLKCANRDAPLFLRCFPVTPKETPVEISGSVRLKFSSWKNSCFKLKFHRYGVIFFTVYFNRQERQKTN